MKLKQHRKEQFWFWRYLKFFTTGIGLILGTVVIILLIVSAVNLINAFNFVSTLNSQGNGGSQTNIEEVKQQVNTMFSVYDSFEVILGCFTTFITFIALIFLSRVGANILLGIRGFYDYKKIIDSKSILIWRIVKHSISVICTFVLMICFFVILNFVQDMINVFVNPMSNTIHSVKGILKNGVENMTDSQAQQITNELEKLFKHYETINFDQAIGKAKLDSIISTSITILVFNILMLLNIIITNSITLAKVRKFEPSADLSQKQEQAKLEKEEKKKAKKEAKEQAKQEKLKAQQENETATQTQESDSSQQELPEQTSEYENY